jgi:ABC-2 type transport system ATP-binding protein
MTTLVSSHDIAEIENVADHVGFLRDGRLTVSESLESLLARFREVEVVLPEGAAPPAVKPASWLRPAQTGGALRFIETCYEPGVSEAAWAEAVPAATSIEGTPMSLRQIFVALARQESAS